MEQLLDAELLLHLLEREATLTEVLDAENGLALEVREVLAKREIVKQSREVALCRGQQVWREPRPRGRAYVLDGRRGVVATPLHHSHRCAGLGWEHTGRQPCRKLGTSGGRRWDGVCREGLGVFDHLLRRGDTGLSRGGATPRPARWRDH